MVTARGDDIAASPPPPRCRCTRSSSPRPRFAARSPRRAARPCCAPTRRVARASRRPSGPWRTTWTRASRCSRPPSLGGTGGSRAKPTWRPCTRCQGRRRGAPTPSTATRECVSAFPQAHVFETHRLHATSAPGRGRAPWSRGWSVCA